MRDSWLFIIIQIFLSVLFPPLGVIWMAIGRLAYKYGVTAQGALSAFYIIAAGFIASVSPIIAVIAVVQDGLANAFNSVGFAFAVIIFEVHMSLRFIWNTKISKKLNIVKEPHESICKNHQPLFIILALGYSALMFKLLASDIKDTFFKTLIFIYGAAFFIWDSGCE